MDHLPLTPAEYTQRRIRVLSAAAILALLVVAYVMLMPKGKEAPVPVADTKDTNVVPIPTESEIATASIFSQETRTKLKEIQDQFARGEIHWQDAERMMNEVLAQDTSTQ